jgi:tagatose 6-phosphate kinase
VILCAAPSPAWDVTYHLDRLRLGETNRARSVSARAGGKTVNVARLLSLLGEDVTVVAPLGGTTGGFVADDLAAAGVTLVPVPGQPETRRTTTMVDDDAGDATLVSEPSRIGSWGRFVDCVDSLLASADVMVAGGSMPVDAPIDGFAELCRLGRAHRVPVVVDTSGAALLAALDAGPDVVKPNVHELADVRPHDDPVQAASELAATSGSAVAVSLGPEGLALTCDAGTWVAHPGEVVHGNPIGAGDAVTAALARGLLHGRSWPDVAVDAVALSAAAVRAPYAGEVDLRHVDDLRASVRLDRLDRTA